MRLPWGNLNNIVDVFLKGRNFAILGCLSPEERCCVVPKLMFSTNCQAIELLEIRDPPDAYPDYSTLATQKIEQNRQRLIEAGVSFTSSIKDLLASEDQLLDILDERVPKSPTIVLDITSLPKRYFCFFVNRMLLSDSIKNLIVTYTMAGSNGYTREHLAEDPMSCAPLPGYGAPLPPKGNTLVISVGFESLSIRSLLDVYRDKKRDIKMITSFPPDGQSMRRSWLTLMQIASGNAQNINRDNIETVPVWDAEQVYQILNRWNEDADGLTLAPFGPKPHSLGLTLFAIKHDAGMYYTQPKSYNPDYSKGQGNSWAYVVNWEGIPCFERPSKPL